MARSDLHFERLIWFAVQRAEYIKIEQLKIVSHRIQRRELRLGDRGGSEE